MYELIQSWYNHPVPYVKQRYDMNIVRNVLANVLDYAKEWLSIRHTVREAIDGASSYSARFPLKGEVRIPQPHAPSIKTLTMFENAFKAHDYNEVRWDARRGLIIAKKVEIIRSTSSVYGPTASTA